MYRAVYQNGFFFFNNWKACCVVGTHGSRSYFFSVKHQSCQLFSGTHWIGSALFRTKNCFLCQFHISSYASLPNFQQHASLSHRIQNGCFISHTFWVRCASSCPESEWLFYQWHTLIRMCFFLSRIQSCQLSHWHTLSRMCFFWSWIQSCQLCQWHTTSRMCFFLSWIQSCQLCQWHTLSRMCFFLSRMRENPRPQWPQVNGRSPVKIY